VGDNNATGTQVRNTLEVALREGPSETIEEP